MNNRSTLALRNSTVIFEGFPEYKCIITNINQLKQHTKQTFLFLTGDLLLNKDIIITETGCKYSLRNTNNTTDNVVYFGVTSEANDVLIKNPYSASNASYSKYQERLFGIRIDKEKLQYRIFTEHIEYPLYCLLTDVFYFYINTTYSLKLGNVVLLFTPMISDNDDDSKVIEIKIENVQTQHKLYFEDKQMPISIGRKDCGINIQHHSISKQHGMLAYSQSEKSFYYNDTNSKNGSFLVVNYGYSLLIQGEMFFVFGNWSFKLWELQR